jgi:formate dehydrogenase maturation protein FdhE
MTNVALAHLYALRAHIDAVILLMEGDAGISTESDPGMCPQCGASPDQVTDASTLDGTRKSRCAQCGAVWER